MGFIGSCYVLRPARETDPIRDTNRTVVMDLKDSPTKHLLITGSTIGNALAQEFAADDAVALITLTYKSRCPDITSKKIITRQLDVADEDAVHNTFKNLERLDGVINAVGFLHGEGFQPEKSISRASTKTFFKNMEANTLPTILLAKHSRNLLKDSLKDFSQASQQKLVP